MKKIIAIVLFIAAIGSGVYFTCFSKGEGISVFKSDDEKIVERLEAFETAYASGDLDGCLDCLDSKSRNALKGIGKISSALGYGIGDLFSGMFSLGVATQDEQVKFKVKEIKYTDKTHAKVTAEVWLSEDYLYDETTSVETFEMVKEKNDWYLVEDF